MIELKATLLQIDEGIIAENKMAWQAVIARVGEKMGKFKVDLSKIKFTQEDIDKEFTFVCEIAGNVSTYAMLRITATK